MTEVTSYVVVPDDENDKTIVGGPYLWDGGTEWTPPDPGVLLRESDALAKGYRYREVPTPDEQDAP